MAQQPSAELLCAGERACGGSGRTKAAAPTSALLWDWEAQLRAEPWGWEGWNRAAAAPCRALRCSCEEGELSILPVMGNLQIRLPRALPGGPYPVLDVLGSQ